MRPWPGCLGKGTPCGSLGTHNFISFLLPTQKGGPVKQEHTDCCYPALALLLPRTLWPSPVSCQVNILLPTLPICLPRAPARPFSQPGPVLLLALLLPCEKPCASSHVNTLLSSENPVVGTFGLGQNLRICDKVRSFSPQVSPHCSTAWGGCGSNSTVLIRPMSIAGSSHLSSPPSRASWKTEPFLLRPWNFVAGCTTLSVWGL